MTKLNEGIGIMISNSSGITRDAVHVAVARVIAGNKLKPGQMIRITLGMAYSAAKHDAVAIVDPFLENDVETGYEFWAVMMPNTVRGLHHSWEHDSFPAPEVEVEYDDGCRGC